MTTPRDDIAGLSERLRSFIVDTTYGKGLCMAMTVEDIDEAATQLDALSARVAEMTSLLAISEDLRRKVIDVAEQWQSRADALSARVKELEAHCRRLGQGGAERYWEGRWRDEAAENTRLQQERDEAYERAAKVAENPPKPEGRGHTCIATGRLIAAAIRRLASGPEKEKKE